VRVDICVCNTHSCSACPTLTYDTITDGGTQTASGFPDFLSYFNQFNFGGEDGIVLIAYDNTRADSDDRIIIDLSFNQPVFNLSFDMLNWISTNTFKQSQLFHLGWE